MITDGATDILSLVCLLEKSNAPKKLSNTEILCSAALVGAQSAGANTEFYSLANLFPRREQRLHQWPANSVGVDEALLYHDTLEIDEARLFELVAKIKWADAIVLASPVYFGDRSSVMSKLLAITRSRKLLQDKVVAALSVGAKRNGGQETTNLFLLHEASTQGAYVVGNGPPNAQFGGTAQAGDKGTVILDAWGLETSFATGKRVAEIAHLLAAGKIPEVNSDEIFPKIVVVVTMDSPERAVANRLALLLEETGLAHPKIRFSLLELADLEIERCLACDVCPIPSLRVGPENYACIIQTPRDAMERAREVLQSADGILFAGINAAAPERIMDRYQSFTERTRFIRRNDFELSHIPVASFLVEETNASHNSLFGLKVLTSYLRHNTLLCPPARELWHEDKVLRSAYTALSDFFRRVDSVTVAKQKAQRVSVQYLADGYCDKSLDHTEAFR